MKRSAGFSLIEVIIGMVIGSIVMAGAYSLWLTHQTEGNRLSHKIDLRNKLTLASKRIQKSITLAGIGLAGSANLSKNDAVGSDTLVVFLNTLERSSGLTGATSHHTPVVQVANPSLFEGAEFVGIAGGGNAELRRVVQVSGSSLQLDTAFDNDYPVAGTLVFPADRERYYTDQDSSQFIRETLAGAYVVATDVRNFQISFADKHGESTEIPGRIRTVRYSLTGIYPAKEGSLSTMVFSSTAIPRNTL